MLDTVSDEVRAVAERLYQVLWRELQTKKCKSIYSSGDARVIKLTYHADNDKFIGMFSMWSVTLEDLVCFSHYSVPITHFEPPSALYPLFRNAFERFGVRVDHPHARAFYGDAPVDFNSPPESILRFTPGDIIVVTADRPVFVRPRGDARCSVWVTAELRVDMRSKGWGIGCNVDALSLVTDNRARHGSQCGDRFLGQQLGVDKALTLFVLMTDGNRNSYIPLARLVGYDPEIATHTFQLDAGAVVLAQSEDAVIA